MNSRSFFFGAALIVVSVPLARAQDATVLLPGTRVRIVAAGIDPRERTGRIVHATRDTITFRSDENPATRTLALSDIASIDISGGEQTHRGRDALYGLAIGGAAGAAISAATYSEPKCSIYCAPYHGRSGVTASGAIAGSVFGAALGAFVFANFDKTERWVPLRKSASIQLSPAVAGMKLAVSAHF